VRITKAQQVDERLDELMKKAWVVYTKSYLTQADTVVKYLSQYSHKYQFTAVFEIRAGYP